MEIQSEKRKEFLDKIDAISKEYDMCIGHQDYHGAFIIYNKYIPKVIEWLKEAELENW
jgi:hypothetical protein